MSGVAYKTGVTASSSTQDDIAPGLLTGHVRTEPDGSKYVLLKAGGTILDGECVMADTTNDSELTVIVTTGLTVRTIAVDNRGGSALASGDYFWGKCYGRGYITPTVGGWSAGQYLTGSASGEGDEPTLGTHQVFAVAISDDDQTTDANNLVWITGAT